MTRVSVALALYRGERYIGEQIESLLKQTRQPDEIVICDDSPDDLSYKALEPWLGSGVIRYYRNEACLGVCGNFSGAIGHCTGDLIFLCDQDDVWLPEKIARYVALFERAPDISGVFADSHVVNADLSDRGFSLWEMRGFTAARQKAFRPEHSLEIFLKRVYLSGHNIAFRAEFKAVLLPIPDFQVFYPDTWIALVVAALGRWTALPEALTLYRVHESNQSAPSRSGLLRQFLDSRRAAAKGKLADGERLLRVLTERCGAEVPEEKRLMLVNGLRHFQRLNAPRHRVWNILREVCNGSYRRYGNGLKSAAADLANLLIRFSE